MKELTYLTSKMHTLLTLRNVKKLRSRMFFDKHVIFDDNYISPLLFFYIQ